MGKRVSDEEVAGILSGGECLSYPGLSIDLALDLQDERERNAELTKLANISKALKNCDRCGSDVAQYCVGCMEKNNAE